MSSPFPTITGFFGPRLPPSSPSLIDDRSSVSRRTKSGLPRHTPGDGFTSSESSRSHHLSQADWQPKEHYDEVPIGQLAPGLRNVMIIGRVINLFDMPVTSKMSKAARGCIKILIKDDQAALVVS